MKVENLLIDGLLVAGIYFATGAWVSKNQSDAARNLASTAASYGDVAGANSLTTEADNEMRGAIASGATAGLMVGTAMVVAGRRRRL